MLTPGNYAISNFPQLSGRDPSFSGADFTGTCLDHVSFSHCEWQETGRLFRHRLLYEKPPLYDEAEEQYREFKRKFEKLGDYHNANQFHVSELEMRRLLMKKRLFDFKSDILAHYKKPHRMLSQIFKASFKWNSRVRQWIADYIVLTIWGFLSLYGNSYSRVIRRSFIAVILFSAGFMLTGLAEPTGDTGYSFQYKLTSNPADIAIFFTSDFWRDYPSCIIHTISLFTFVRIKHFACLSWLGQAWEVAASVVGPVLLALFVFSLRKTFRTLRI